MHTLATPYTFQPQEPVGFAPEYKFIGGTAYIASQPYVIGANTVSSDFGDINRGVFPGGKYISCAFGSPYVSLPPLKRMHYQSQMTWVCQFTHTASAGYIGAFGSGDNGATGHLYVEQFNVGIDGGGGDAGNKFRFVIRDYGGGTLGVGPSGNPIIANKLHTIAIIYLDGSTVDIWLDGQLVPLSYVATGFANTDTGTNTFPQALCNFHYGGSAAGSSPNFRLSMYARIPARLPGKELSLNPWLLFEPIPFTQWIAPTVIPPSGYHPGMWHVFT